MKEVYKYIDFRKYLADFYKEKKQTTRHFSYRYFAQRACIKSPVFLKQVIDGERNLTRQMIEKFIPALNLNKKESLYFKNLVLFNQAKNAHEKQESYSIMLSMMNHVPEFQLSSSHCAYFDKWFNSVICLYDFKDDFDLIAKTVKPQITDSESKKAVHLLLRLKLIAKQSDGTYRQRDMAIISNDDIVALARRSFNSEILLLARNANETLSQTERNISGITIGISKACYDVILREQCPTRKIKIPISISCGNRH